MERILLTVIVSLVVFASEIPVSEWSFNRGSHDFNSRMLKLSMKLYRSAWHWVILVLVLCSSVLSETPVPRISVGA